MIHVVEKEKKKARSHRDVRQFVQIFMQTEDKQWAKIDSGLLGGTFQPTNFDSFTEIQALN